MTSIAFVKNKTIFFIYWEFRRYLLFWQHSRRNRDCNRAEGVRRKTKFLRRMERWTRNGGKPGRCPKKMKLVWTYNVYFFRISWNYGIKIMKNLKIIFSCVISVFITGCSSTKKIDDPKILDKMIREKQQRTVAEILDENENPDWTVYKHVIVVGIDGAGTFEGKCNTPHIDAIFSNGVWTPKCKASKPTISAECWGSMLTGIEPQVHMLTNERVDNYPYEFEAYPTIFSLARKTHPEAKLGAFCGWAPIYKGIIEQGIGVVTGTGTDDKVAKQAADYIRAEKPELVFVQFDSVDHAGHNMGYCTKDYFAALEAVDDYVAEIYLAAQEAGILEDTLFILTADHGGIFKGHGGNTLSESRVYFGAVGKTVPKNTKLSLEGRDLAAIVCRALNLKTNKKWHSSVPKKMFKEPRPAKITVKE